MNPWVQICDKEIGIYRRSKGLEKEKVDLMNGIDGLTRKKEDASYDFLSFFLSFLNRIGNSISST